MKIIALEEHFAMDGLKSMVGGGSAFAVVDKTLAAEWERQTNFCDSGNKSSIFGVELGVGQYLNQPQTGTFFQEFPP